MSLYLDLLRFVAAMEVFAFHISSFPFLGIERSAWNAYGHEAVTIFFVLSGFVIRHAAGSRDSDMSAFATSRITRVYSVALPCLVLTLLFDTVGRTLAPDYYAGLIPDGSALLRLAIGAAMMNEAWVSVQILSNTPYWSISYEVWYYAIFAATFYCSGRSRWLLVTACSVIAGPKILLLFPIWAMGWLAYVERGSARLPVWVSLALFMQPVAMLMLFDQFHLARAGGAFLEAQLGHDLWRNGLAWSRFVFSDTALGLSVALHLVGAKGLGQWLWSALSPFETPIRFGAARSFTLYLLHQPAILFAAALLATAPLGAWRGLIVAAASLGIIILVALVTEGQRHRFKPVAAAIVQGAAIVSKQIFGARQPTRAER
ncbi:MAG: acyltransferase family protein [Sphingomonadaceae bacterium]